MKKEIIYSSIVSSLALLTAQAIEIPAPDAPVPAQGPKQKAEPKTDRPFKPKVAKPVDATTQKSSAEMEKAFNTTVLNRSIVLSRSSV